MYSMENNQTLIPLELNSEDWKLVKSRKKQFLNGELKSVSLKDIRKKALQRTKRP